MVKTEFGDHKKLLKAIHRFTEPNRQRVMDHYDPICKKIGEDDFLFHPARMAWFGDMLAASNGKTFEDGVFSYPI